MIKVRNMTSERSGREVANHFHIREGNNVYFQSYDSVIVKIDRTNNEIIFDEDTWNYSTTTGKYRNQFMREELGMYTNVAECRKAIDEGKIILADLN